MMLTCFQGDTFDRFVFICLVMPTVVDSFDTIAGQAALLLRCPTLMAMSTLNVAESRFHPLDPANALHTLTKTLRSYQTHSLVSGVQERVTARRDGA